MMGENVTMIFMHVHKYVYDYKYRADESAVHVRLGETEIE